MVLPAAGLLGGTIARGTIVLGARIAAIDKFQQLAGVTRTAGRNMLGLSRVALIAAGQFTILSTALKILTHPITGLLALLQTGLATRSWLLYIRSMRMAQLQLLTTGQSLDQVNLRLERMRLIMGAAAAQEIFRNTRALSNLTKAGQAWETEILGMSNKLELLGADYATFTEIASGALKGSLQDFERLKQIFPEITAGAKTPQEALEEIAAALDQVDLTNMEQLVERMGEVRDRTDPIIGRFNDMIALVPLLGVTLLKGVVGTVLSFFRDIGDIIPNLAMIITTPFDAIGESLAAIFTGNLEKLPGIWSEVATELQRRLGEFAGQVVGIVTLGLFDRVVEAGKLIGTEIKTSFSELGIDVDKLNANISGVLGQLGKNFIDFVAGLPGQFSSFFGTEGTLFGILDGVLNNWTSFWSPTSGLVRVLQIWIAGVFDMFKRLFDSDLVQLFINLGKTVAANIDIWFLAPLKQALNAFVGLINRNLIDRMNNIRVPDWSPVAPGMGRNIPRIPTFARGGTVPGPLGSPIMVQAHGGEQIVPNAGTQTINIYIGDKKIDSVVLDSMNRLVRFRGGINASSGIHA